MVDALSSVALVQFVPDKPAHHDLDPLLANDGIRGLLHSLIVVEVDAVEGRRDLGLLGQESFGFGGGHGGRGAMDVANYIPRGFRKELRSEVKGGVAVE